jgi:hypothetical protein
VQTQYPTWLHGLEPLMDRRQSDRRSLERRSGPRSLSEPRERRAGQDRRVRERRETATEHLRNALQVMLHASAGRDLPAETVRDLTAAIRRVWLALQELERGLPYTR